MQQKTYTILGIIIIAISLILSSTWIPSSIRSNPSIWVDGIWFMILGILSVFVLGILYLLFGLGKLEINRLSNISVKFILVGFGISIVGIPLLYLYITITNSDPMGLILAAPILFISYLLSIIALVLAIISIFKSTSS